MWPAIIGAVGSIAGGLLSKKSSSDATSSSEEQRARSLDYIKSQLAQGRSDVLNLFPQALQSQNTGMQSAVDVYRSAFPQAANTLREGNMRAQGTLLAGLPQMNNAILGAPIDYSQMQVRGVPVDANALAGMFNAPDFSGFVNPPRANTSPQLQGYQMSPEVEAIYRQHGFM